MRLVCSILWLAVGLNIVAPGQSADLVFEDLEKIPRHPLEPGDKVASVLVFYGQDCPIANGYAPEINRLWRGHTNFAFFIVQVDPELTVAAAKEHARKYDLRPPVLLDRKHQLVKLAKATVTPEAVVLGKKGQILYRGRIDDLYVALGKKRAAVTERNLRDALDALAAGKAVRKSETKAIGCLIQ
jgi:AhpC/TSA family protein